MKFMKYVLLLCVFSFSLSSFAKDKAFYLEKKSGHTVHICSEKADGKVMVSDECSGFFGLFFKEREVERKDLIKYVKECDGIRQQKDLVMIPSNLEDVMWATQMFDDGTVYLLSDTQKDRRYYNVSNIRDLIREVPEFNGYKKGQKVCLKKDTKFEDRISDSLIRPFPVQARQNSEFLIESIFANGQAKVKYRDKFQLTNSGYTSILQAVSLEILQPCD